MAYDGRVLVLVADGFREMGVLSAVTSLRNAGVETLLVGLRGGTVSGAHGIAVTVDATLSEIRVSERDAMVVIPGGWRCTKALLNDPRVHQLLEHTTSGGGEVAVLSGAERLVDKTIAGAAAFRHQDKQGLEGFLQTCVAELGSGRRFANEQT